MKQRLIISLLGAALLLLGIAAPALAKNNSFYAGTYFGTTTYEDAEGNGFSSSLLAGVTLDYSLGIGHSFDLDLRYKYATSLNSVASASAWSGMPPGYIPEEDGVLTNMIPSVAFRFRFADNRGHIGIGYMKYDFGVQETGFEELRAYSGMFLEFDFETAIKAKKGYFVKFLYAPSFAVHDWVRGDWDDPNRYAVTDYDGSLMALEGGMSWALGPKLTLSAGITYQLLSGDGQYHVDYRFLEHTFLTTGFTFGAKWRL